MTPADPVGPTRVRFRCAAAWIDGAVRGPVDIVCTDGTISAVEAPGIDPPGTGGAASGEPLRELPGLVLPGFADAHSHVFHRALRGRTHVDADNGSFWTWRQQMYRLADRLDPDSLRELATAGYVELVCAGYTAVGEFHYLHHRPGGQPYNDPNAMGLAVADAAAGAGIGLTLLDTLYLSGGFGGRPLSATQQRFSDGSVQAWADRVAILPTDLRVGLALHSVRAVPPEQLPEVAAVRAGRLLHVHLSEQPQENADCLAATGATPTRLLADAGLLGSATAAVHATHLSDDDLALLAASGSTVVICPATEADLADGLPRTGELADRAVPLACGGDQQVVVDPFVQARGIELGHRLASGVRGRLSPAELLVAATEHSHRAIGSTGGRIAVGAPADLVVVRTDSARTAGADPGQLVMVATAADVATVVIGGEVVARDGVHTRLGAPGEMLAALLRRLRE